MRRRTTLSENDLNRIVAKSVQAVLNEGLGNRLSGAAWGFQQGRNEMDYRAYDSRVVDHIFQMAEMGLKNNDPQSAMQMLQKLYNLIRNNRITQKNAGRKLKYNY